MHELYHRIALLCYSSTFDQLIFAALNFRQNVLMQHKKRSAAKQTGPFSTEKPIVYIERRQWRIAVVAPIMMSQQKDCAP
jgi:hypothetical protein